MKLLQILLDGVTIEALLGISLLFVVLPLTALILLIWFFVKRKNKNK